MESPSHRCTKKKPLEFNELLYPLVSVNKKRWKITMFHEKTHYFDCAIFTSYVNHYQRVSFITSSCARFKMIGIELPQMLGGHCARMMETIETWVDECP